MDINTIAHRGLTSIKKQGNVSSKKEVKESFLTITAETDDVHQTVKTSTIQAVMPYLHDDGQKKQQQKALQKGGTILSKLKVLRMSIIEGRINHQTLLELERLIADMDQTSLPDHLLTLMDEIKTRAAVELAKYRNTPINND